MAVDHLLEKQHLHFILTVAPLFAKVLALLKLSLSIGFIKQQSLLLCLIAQARQNSPVFYGFCKEKLDYF
jgi:hypothetical protein